MRKEIQKLLSGFICAALVITSLPGTVKAGEMGDPPLLVEEDSSMLVPLPPIIGAAESEVESGQNAVEFITADEDFTIDEIEIATVANALKAGLLSTDGDFVINGMTLVQYTGSATTVVIPDGVERIDDRVFYGNRFIEEVIIPDSVISLGRDVFAQTYNLRKIVIGAGLISID